MARESRTNTIRPYVYALVIFLTLGISIANEALSRLGMEGNYYAMFSVAFLLAAILLSRNLKMVALVVIGVLAINLPDGTQFFNIQLDHDLILAVVCAAIFAPSVYELLFK
jgi:glucan phosphoethanolaminetransferase (alkaline phosphatase superfamily)